MPDCDYSAALAGRLDESLRDAAADQRDVLAMAAVAQEIRESRAPVCSRTRQADVRVAIYIRARDGDARRSAQRQHEHLSQIIAAHQHWRLVRVFTAWGSGGADHRPGLSAALVQARVGCFDLLAVHNLDRLARDPRTLLRMLSDLSDAGVAVLFGSDLTAEGVRCPRS